MAIDFIKRILHRISYHIISNFLFFYVYNADMVNMQLCNFVFHSKWSLRITCNKYEGVYRHYVLFLTCPYELLPTVAWYLHIRIKWCPSCAVVFIIESSSLHPPGLGFPVVFIIGTFQWPISWKLLNNCTRGFGREPLVSQLCLCKLLWMKYTNPTQQSVT